MKQDNLTFEEALLKLQKISEKIENEGTPLDEAISLYEEGIALTKFCSETLNNAKQKITSLQSAESEENL